MSPKNILFGTVIVLILMVSIKLLGTDLNLLDLLDSSQTDVVDTSDVYTVTGHLTDDSYTVGLKTGNTASYDNLQPTPANAEEAKSEPVLEVKNITSTNLEGFKEIYSGVFYKKVDTTAIVRVDLNNPNVRFFINPPNGTMTVCSYIQKYGLQLATNGAGFNANTGISGPFSMSEGQIYSTERSSNVTLFITNDNKPIFAKDGSMPDNARYAISGFNRVVQDGKILDRFYPGHPNYKPGYSYLKRRTSIGISGSWLNIVLFDSPITIPAIGEYHLATFPGTEHVYNMDGGGSTNACTADYGSLVTESGRPVANVFGIYAQATK